MKKKGASADENPEGTPADATRVNPAAEAGDTGSDTGDGESLILGRFKTQKDLEDHYVKLEGEHNKKSQHLQRLNDVMQRMSGISDHIEEDPVTGQIVLKAEIREKISGKGSETDTFKDDLRKSLQEKFTARSEKDPAGALVDTVIEAAEMIAERASGKVARTISAGLNNLETSSVMDKHIAANPEDAKIAAHVGAWLESKPVGLRKSITIDEAFEVVRSKLRKTGKLEDLGYDEEAAREGRRSGTGFSGGSSGDEIKPEDEKKKVAGAVKAFKNEILEAQTPMDRFLRGSSKTTRAISPFGRRGN